MSFKFSVKPLADLPPDPKDKFAPVLVAWKQLEPGSALFIEPEEPGNNRSLGQLRAGLRKRLGKDEIVCIDDPTGAGLWVYSRKQPSRPETITQRPAGGSNGGSPFAQHPANAAGAASPR